MKLIRLSSQLFVNPEDVSAVYTDTHIKTIGEKDTGEQTYDVRVDTKYYDYRVYRNVSLKDAEIWVQSIADKLTEALN